MIQTSLSEGTLWKVSTFVMQFLGHLGIRWVSKEENAYF